MGLTIDDFIGEIIADHDPPGISRSRCIELINQDYSSYANKETSGRV